jgi:hypothetical protein
MIILYGVIEYIITKPTMARFVDSAMHIGNTNITYVSFTNNQLACTQMSVHWLQQILYCHQNLCQFLYIVKYFTKIYIQLSI